MTKLQQKFNLFEYLFFIKIFPKKTCWQFLFFFWTGFSSWRERCFSFSGATTFSFAQSELYEKNILAREADENSARNLF